MKKNIIRNIITLPLLVVALTACLLNAVKLEPGAERVEVNKQNPGNQYTEIGPISAENGSKCSKNPSDPKKIGTYENALNTLKNKAAKTNIDYVKIVSTTEPGYKLGCIGKRYAITGTGYRLKMSETRIEQPNRKKSPRPLINAQPVTSPPVVSEQSVNPELPKVNTNTTITEQLRELYTLKEEGVISEKEYQELKDKIIDRF